MVRRAVADANMGEFMMTREQARTMIERARKGLPVSPLDLQRAILIAREREPRKLLLPVLSRLQRLELNATLLHNLWTVRYHTLKEKYDAAKAGKDEPAAVCEADQVLAGG